MKAVGNITCMILSHRGVSAYSFDNIVNQAMNTSPSFKSTNQKGKTFIYQETSGKPVQRVKPPKNSR